MKLVVSIVLTGNYKTSELTLSSVGIYFVNINFNVSHDLGTVVIPPDE